MRINRVSLENFRGYKDINIDINGKDVILFGVNGVGKSSLLRAIDLVFSNIIGAILDTKKRFTDFSLDDIYDHEQYARIEIGLALNDNNEYLYRRKFDNQGKKTHDASALKQIVDKFKNEFIGLKMKDSDGDEHLMVLTQSPMPIFANYGVNRAVIDNPIIENQRNYAKLDAFENAIDSRIDFKGFFSWFKQQEDLENELIARRLNNEKNYTLTELRAVRDAMLAMFSEFSKVRFDRQLNTLIFEKNNEILNINQLSDGEKCTIALFGDIARRLAIANGYAIKNPLEGSGIVLIDEVDLHLHPSWQRKIVMKLKEVFPNIQFIITTHSPQVLGGVGKDFLIYALKTKDKEIFEEKIDSLYGWDSNIILEEAMETPRVNNEILQHINAMYEAYDNGEFEKASSEADYIDFVTNGHNDCVAGVRVMISRRRRATNRETDT